MKRTLISMVLLLMAGAAFAGSGDLTPQQAMIATMNCPVCSAFSEDPALGPTLRYSITQTKHGYIETMCTADENMLPSLNKANAECDRRAHGIAKMSQAEKDKLCPFCQAHMAMAEVKGLEFESVDTPLGKVTVATAQSPEGVKALHSYAKKAQKQSDLMAKASAAMGTMESKM